MGRKAPTPISLFDCDTPKYDYPGIDDPLVLAALKQHTTSIRRRMQQVAESIMDIGRNLEEVRKRLQHGQYRDWLQAEFKMSEDTALNFRNVWKRFGSKNIQLGNLGCSVVYLLAAPSTPQTAIDEMLEKDRQGATLSVAEAKEIIKRHQTPTDETEKSETENFGFSVDSDQEPPRKPPYTQQVQEYLACWRQAIRDIDTLHSRLLSLRQTPVGDDAAARTAASQTAKKLAGLGHVCRTLARNIRHSLEHPPEEDGQ